MERCTCVRGCSKDPILVRGNLPTHLLVGNRLGSLSHELLDALDVHFIVQLLEHRVALPQAKEDVLLDQRELDG